MKILAKLLYGLSLLLFITLSGCARNPAITNIWMDKDYDGHKYKKILVIGAAEKITYRTLFEDELGRQLNSQGIEAVPSNVFLPYNEKLTREIIQSAVEKSDIDSVLITSLVEKREEKFSYSTINDNNPYDYYNGFWLRTSDYKNYNAAAYSKTYMQETFLLLKTNLYDMRSEKLIWSMTSESPYESQKENPLKPVIKLITNKLVENGLI